MLKKFTTYGGNTMRIKGFVSDLHNGEYIGETKERRS